MQEFEPKIDQEIDLSIDQEMIQGTNRKSENVSYVTQSRYFSPVFNAAIFDGPIRIYFAQVQEAQALKLYYNLQERYTEVRRQARGLFKARGQNIFVMMYPNDETFDLSFSGDTPLDPRPTGAGAEVGPGTQIIRATLGKDFVIGVRGPIEDEDLESLCREMDQIVSAPIAI